MNKIILCILCYLLFSCVNNTNKDNIAYTLDNPSERVVWEKLKLMDPTTGDIPRNIRKKELIFSKTLPKTIINNKSNWVHRGPYNVGGRTRALAMDVLNEDILLAGGASGGMFRSIDAGQSWSMTTKANQLHNVTCLSQDTRNGKENIWYFGSGELTGSSASAGGAYYGGNGIYKSIDGGLSWDSLSITATNTPHSFDSDFDYIWNIKTDPSNDTLDVVYAATYGSIYKSENGGDSWSKVLGGNSYYTNVEVTSSGVVYATLSTDFTPNINQGIWRSEDGNTWTNITDSLFAERYKRIAIGINPLNEDIVYFLAAETCERLSDDPQYDGPDSIITCYGEHTDVFFGRQTCTSLWKYNASDNVWTDLSHNIPSNQATSFDNFNAQGSYDLLVKVHPEDSNTVYIGGTNLWRSTDGFTTRNNTMIIGGYSIGSSEGDGNWGVYKNHHPDQHDLLFYPSNSNIILSATDGGVYKSYDTFADTVEWVSLNNGYYTSQLYAVSISRNANSNVMHGGFQDNGNFVTFNNSVTSHWNMPFNGDGAYGAIADNEEDFYLSIQRGVMYKMKLDTNGNRVAFNRMDPASIDSNDYLFINPLVMDNNQDIIYLSASNKLWRNNDVENIPYNNSHLKSDFGWEMFTDTLTNPLRKISTIETSTNPPNIVYLGTSSKYVYRVDNANLGDPPIIQLPDILVSPQAYCYDIAVNPDNANELIVVYSNYGVYSLFHSLDGGQNWNKIAGNLEQYPSGAGIGPSCRSAKIIPFGNNTLYLVGTSVGLFATTSLDFDNDSTLWKQVASDEIGSVVCEYLEYRKSDNLLVVATHANGIYQINLTSPDDLLNLENIESSGFSFNIYPNPVDKLCKINFKIDKNIDDLELIIYDELGRLVERKNISVLNIGNNTIDVKMNNFKAGVYFITLKLGEELFTKQIIKK